jgi:hypothetical protein
MQMMGEVKLPLAPEPREAFQTRSLDVIFLVNKDMRVAFRDIIQRIDQALVLRDADSKRGDGIA